MAKIQSNKVVTNIDSCLLMSWLSLAWHTGTCTVTGGNLLSWLTGTHGFTANDIGSVAWFTPTGGTAGLYQIASVGSTTTLTAVPVGFTASNVSSVACGVGDTGAEWSQRDAVLDRTLQVHGTFGSGGTLGLFGSNDGVNWAIASDNTGTNLSITTVKVRNIFDGPLWYKPMLTGGDATTNLSALISLRGQLPRAIQ